MPEVLIVPCLNMKEGRVVKAIPGTPELKTG